MNMKQISTIFGVALLAGTVHAQYGQVDNFTGIDRFGFDQNLTEGTSGSFQFGGVGGGAGEVADVGPDGVGDKALDGGAGGDLSGGGFGYGIALSSSIDRTATVNGMTNTGYTLDFSDREDDGDVYFFRVESGGFDRSETFVFSGDSGFSGDEATSTSLGNGWSRITFTPGTGTLNTAGGSFDEDNIQNLVVGSQAFDGGGTTGGATFYFDNFGFTGNLVPTTGVVTDFSEQSAGALSLSNPESVPTGTVSPNFQGNMEAFAFGDGEVLAANIVDLGGGDLALQANITTADGGSLGFAGGGMLFELGPGIGSQTDVSAFDAISIDIAVDGADVGDTIDVLVEDINAPTFADRCVENIAPTSTLTTYVIPFADFTCGTQGPIATNANGVHRVTILLNTVGGNNSTNLTVDNIQFVDSSSVDTWANFE